MAQIFVTDTEGDSQALNIKPGVSLMETLLDAGYEEILAICGGCVSCATCHVHIIESPIPLPVIEDDEAMLLELADHYDEGNSRLSCQLELDDSFDGLRVQLVEND
jgi:2Fe-2S ferredoxin